jgi:ATP/maltotriose-dependent transcriptional regulator MalT
MKHLGAEPLNLMKTEVQAIIHLHLRGRVDRSMRAFVDQVYRRVGGWAAGLMLILEQAKTKNALVADQSERSSEAIFQYLASEVMQGLPSNTQELLLKTSVLSDISVPLAQQLSNLPHAGQILMSLHEGCYFTERREGSEPSYRYHPLFRDFLLQRAQQILGPTEVRALQRKAAQLLVSNDRIEDGAALLQVAKDWEGLATVILANVEQLISQGRFQTLEIWIRSVPETTLSAWPWLTFWLGIIRMPFNPGEAYQLFY